MRDLNDRLQKNQRIIDQLHDEIKKLKDGAGGGGCDSTVIVQKVRRCSVTVIHIVREWLEVI